MGKNTKKSGQKATSNATTTNTNQKENTMKTTTQKTSVKATSAATTTTAAPEYTPEQIEALENQRKDVPTETTAAQLPAPPAEIKVDLDLLKGELGREDYIKLAKEMNAVMALEPAINVLGGKKGLSDKDLLAAIAEAAKEVEASDFEAADDAPYFTETAKNVMMALGLFVPAKPAKPVTKNEKGKTVKTSTAKTPAAPKYTRAHAFADAVRSLNGIGTKETLVAESDKLYAGKGGNANLKESAWYYNAIVPGLIALEIAHIHDGHLHIRLEKRAEAK